MNQLISPNWHAVLIHYPMGLVAMGLLIELGSFLWRRSTVRAAGRWMLLLGILSCIPAATSGLFAFRQVVNSRLDLDQTWTQVKAESAANAQADRNFFEHTGPRLTSIWHDKQWEQMREHILWVSVGTGILVLTMLVYIGASNVWRQRLYFPLLILLLAGFTGLASGAWHSGEAVYQYGTAVEGPHPTKVDKTVLTSLTTKLQVHAMGAGWVFALGLLSLAVSIRATNETPKLSTDDAWLQSDDATVVHVESGVDSHGRTVVPVEVDPLTEQPRQFESAPPGVVLQPIATSRWWLLMALFAIGTMAGGLWLVEKWNWPALRDMLLKENRNLWHSILGSSILVLSLILAITTRVARKNKWILGFFSLLMLVAMAGQLWLGVLLMYDSSTGPKPQLWKWNPAPVATTTPQT